MKEIISIKDKFIKEATPGIGRVMFDINFNAKTHFEEIKIAIKIKEKFGGYIKILQEKYLGNKISQPDLLWNNKLWEIKNCSSLNSIDTRIRKALKQIKYKENKGGIILNINNYKNTNKEIKISIIKRLKISCDFKIIVIIFLNNKIFDIYQIKEKHCQGPNGPRSAYLYI